MKSKKKLVIIISIVAAILIVFSVVFDIVLQKSETEKTDFAMGAVISLKLTGKGSADTAEEIISAIKNTEKAISRKIEDSEISLLNRSKKAELSGETVDTIRYILEVCQKASGAVDLTIGGLVDLWGIDSENFIVPEKSNIEKTLQEKVFSGLKVEQA